MNLEATVDRLMFVALAALAVLLAGTAPAARAATAATAAPPAAPRLAQQTAATWYGVEVIVFRTSSVNSVEDWDAVPPGRGFGSSAGRGGGT